MRKNFKDMLNSIFSILSKLYVQISDLYFCVNKYVQECKGIACL